MRGVLARRREDEGQALALVLVFLVMFSVVIGLLLTQVQSSFVLNESTQSQSQLLYAADSGLEWAITQLGNSTTCPAGWSNGTPSGVTLNSPTVSGVTISCTQATGPGSNLFGGYAVVTGVNYYGHTSAEGSTTCQSISSDPPNNGTNKTTWGSGSGSCLTYPSGTGGASTPLWSNDTANASPAPTQQLNDVTSPDQTDIWAVGNAAGGQETIWFYDGDDFTDVTTATNTSGITNANLNGVWAADSSHVWAVGAGGDVFACSSSCNTSSSAWVKQTSLNTAPLNDVSGVSATNVYAVGNASGGAGTVISYNSTLGTWGALGTLPAVNKNYFGIYALDTSHIWVVGQSGTILFYDGSTWVKQTAPGGTPDLKAIDGTDTTDLWAAGNNFTITCTANCTASNATWVKVTNAGVANAAAISAGDANDVWIGGGSGGAGAISYCTTSCNTAASTWTSQTLATGTPQLFGMSDASPATGQSWAGHAWAVGAGGVVLTYAPLSTTPTILGKISGGPVFNAQGWNFASGVDVSNNFTQMLSGTGCNTWTQPSNLVVDSGYSATCQSTIPSSLQSLSEPLPTSVPANALLQGGLTVPVVGVTNCPSYVVFTPGTYTSKLSFSKNTTYFFESGVYYFTSGFGAFDNGNSWVTIANLKTGLTSGTNYSSLSVSALTQAVPAGDTLALNGGTQAVTVASPGAPVGATTIPVTTFSAASNFAANTTVGADNLFVIGGQPTTGDSTTISSASPCWSTIQASSYYTAGTGTGVEWITGGSSWMDVHTINLELFTREGGNPATEGAQGISIREIPPSNSSCPATPVPGPWCVSTSSGWTPSNPGSPGQIFQVDANGHYPTVFVHGGLYMPTWNIEEFTNSAAVTLGPIDCNSLEMSFESAVSPALNIEAGTGQPQMMVTATATGKGSFVEHAFWGYATNATKPSVLNWWVDPSNRT